MPLFVAIEAFDLGQVRGCACLGYIASERSLSVGPCVCAGVHQYRYIVEVPQSIGQVILGVWCLCGQSVLSPTLLVRSRGGRWF